jgi:hypothetical protein
MQKKLDASKLTLGTKKEISKDQKQSDENNIETVVKKIHENSLHPSDDALKEPTKRTTLDIPKPLHKIISRHALDKDLTLKDYFLELAKKDLGV